MPDSTTTGYLRPTSVAPLDGDALDDVLAAAVVGIVGLDATLVRPRWQANPPAQPTPTTDWCAIGVTAHSAGNGVYTQHVADGNDTLRRLEQTIDVLASFYGPNCLLNAEIMRDGLALQQNIDVLEVQGLKLIRVDELTRVPDLTNMQWINRCDLPIIFRRETQRVYSIRDIVEVQGTLTDTTTGFGESFDTTPVVLLLSTARPLGLFSGAMLALSDASRPLVLSLTTGEPLALTNGASLTVTPE